MRLEFIYVPVKDLAPALALYRDTLGLDELWREGDLTVGLGIPGNEAPLMVDAQATPDSGPGPVLSVDRVDDWLAGLDGELDVFQPPHDIPGGRMLGFRDGAGNCVYVMDQSTAE